MRASTRQVLWSVLFAAIVIGGIDMRVVRLLLRSDTTLDDPERDTRDYAVFLHEVAAHTQPGETILLVAPWYEYPFYRASYLLPDRRVIPLLERDERPRPERLRDASTVAVWRMPKPEGSFVTVWSGAEGMLLRRRR